jgi:pSer/pThr/pTyr-binding forkhead associated (FHA) protein
MKFKEGTRLRYSISDDNGVLLLTAGTRLTPRLVSILNRRGIQLQLSASLEVVKGEPLGLQIPVANGSPFRVGRSPECELRPGSLLVSGQHCRITLKLLSVEIKDMGSTNGTYVNDVEIHQPTTLEDGDVIRFGDMAVRIHLLASLLNPGEEGEVIAGLILANQAGKIQDPPTGDTMFVDPEEGGHLVEALQEAWKKRQQTQE